MSYDDDDDDDDDDEVHLTSVHFCLVFQYCQ